MPQIVWEKIFVMWTTSRYTFYFSLDVDLPKEKSLEDRLDDSVANHPCHHHHQQRTTAAITTAEAFNYLLLFVRNNKSLK